MAGHLLKHPSDGFAALHLDPKYSDLTIACDGEQFKVHQVVVCNFSPVLARQVGGKSHGAHTRELYPTGFDAATLGRMLEYMYTLDYGKQVKGTTGLANVDLTSNAGIYKTCVTELASLGTNDTLIVHAQMNAIAKHYEIPGLQALATQKCTESASQGCHAKGFIDILKVVYADARTADAEIRNRVVDLAYDHIYTLLRDDDFQNSIAQSHDLRDFQSDMLEKLSLELARNTVRFGQDLEVFEGQFSLAKEELGAKDAASAQDREDFERQLNLVKKELRAKDAASTQDREKFQRQLNLAKKELHAKDAASAQLLRSMHADQEILERELDNVKKELDTRFDIGTQLDHSEQVRGTLELELHNMSNERKIQDVTSSELARDLQAQKQVASDLQKELRQVKDALAAREIVTPYPAQSARKHAGLERAIKKAKAELKANAYLVQQTEDLWSELDKKRTELHKARVELSAKEAISAQLKRSVQDHTTMAQKLEEANVGLNTMSAIASQGVYMLKAREEDVKRLKLVIENLGPCPSRRCAGLACFEAVMGVDGNYFAVCRGCNQEFHV